MMRRFLQSGFFVLLPAFLFIAIFAGSADSTDDVLEISVSTDKSVYDASDTIHVVVRIENRSSKEQVLKPRKGNDFSLGIYGKGRILIIYPKNMEITDSIVIKAGETKVFKYELLSYRAVLYSEYVEKLRLNIQGPWIVGVPLPAPLPLTIVTDYKELLKPSPEIISKYFAENDIFIKAFGDTIVKLRKKIWSIYPI